MIQQKKAKETLLLSCMTDFMCYTSLKDNYIEILEAVRETLHPKP